MILLEYMRYLGIDYGTKKVGIAVSDDEGSFAFPENIISTTESIRYIKTFVEHNHIGGIVIGESLATNGGENEVVERVKSFAQKLETVVTVPIVFEREGFSSVEAHRYQTKKGNRDDSAAAVILQRFLDKRKK